jgi:hypothetical protein
MPDLKWLRYGNWCGPGPKPPADPPAKNDTDATCRIHDLGYRQCGLVGGDALKASLPGGGNDCSIPHDYKFVDRLDQEKDNLDPKEKRANRIIRNYFATKLAADKRLGREKSENPTRRKEDASRNNWRMSFANWLSSQGGGPHGFA